MRQGKFGSVDSGGRFAQNIGAALELRSQRRVARSGGGGQRKYSISETVFAISAECVRKRAELFMLTPLRAVGRMARACFYNFLLL